MAFWWDPTTNLCYFILDQESQEFRLVSPRQPPYRRRVPRQDVPPCSASLVRQRAASYAHGVTTSGLMQQDEELLAAIEKENLITRVIQMQEETWQMATTLWNHYQDLKAQLTSLRAERRLMKETYEELMEAGDELDNDVIILAVYELLREMASMWVDVDGEVQEVKRQLRDYWNLYGQTEVLYFENRALIIEALVGEYWI
ncbi:hypothetical protein SVAN01_10689 [Stagonosporopsis vannaccii]|nr:hypothetical protein SVAN01_10689 [Stagonosporopsis vannaccii]